MTLSQLHNSLTDQENLTFQLPNGSTIAPHFHITEVGLVTKHFVDCGGTERIEKKINLQLWEANDFDHRVSATKFRSILEMSTNRLGLGDLEIEVEYQGETIGKYGLDFTGDVFRLTNKQTACLASDACGIPEVAFDVVNTEVALDLSDMAAKTSCEPGGGCC